MTLRKAVILAAGYGNRIRDFSRLSEGDLAVYDDQLKDHEDLLKNTPKPLLPVWGHPIMTLLLKKIERETKINEVYVVTNSNYFPSFEKWKEQLKTDLEVKVLDNGVNTLGQCQGWIKDLYHVIKVEEIAEDILLLAGDTIFGFELSDLIKKAEEVGTDVLATYPAAWEDLHRRGVVVLGADGRVDKYLEKPKNPPCNDAGIIAYVLKKETLSLLPQAVEKGYYEELNLMQWLRDNDLREIYALKFKERIDIGNPIDFFEVNRRQPLEGWNF